MIQVMINGEPKEFKHALTVAQMLENLGLEQEKIAVERNLMIVPRSAYMDMRLEAGDALEIVQFIGGG